MLQGWVEKSSGMMMWPPSAADSQILDFGQNLCSDFIGGNHSQDFAPAGVRIGPPAGVRTPPDDFHLQVG